MFFQPEQAHPSPQLVEKLELKFMLKIATHPTPFPIIMGLKTFAPLRQCVWVKRDSAQLSDKTSSMAAQRMGCL